MDGIIIVRGEDGSYIKCTNEALYHIDPYGNEICITDMAVQYKQNAPTYDELYEYWIKTKDLIGEKE